MEESTNGQTRQERIENWILDHPIGFWLVVFCSILFLLIIYWAIWSDISPEWTGFGKYIAPNGEFVRHKTLWDWMDLLIVPVALAIGAFWLNSSQKKTELTIADEQSKQAILEAYFDQMTDLLLNRDLRNIKDPNSEERIIARTRTLAVLRNLDGDRKGQVIQFLYDSDLIQRDRAIVNLSGKLNEQAEASESIWRTDLRGANLSNGYMFNVDLSGVDLAKANLSRTIMLGVTLKNTNLCEADLSKSTLNGVDFEGAILDRANLLGARVGNALLKNAKSLKNAIMPDGTKYEKWLENQVE